MELGTMSCGGWLLVRPNKLLALCSEQKWALSLRKIR